ncbi:Aste57867_17920 [Aphanomyces stellatus]|uniref:Elicitin n=1 Tax=Aphanomyces stellatus TaxID=120398 RepID=A0A485L931_9STRA|nr:hypothetical protein As57867_017859 [Aphanomyces stellatus]VFT94662.1 Aste57867_17920 [Aphanomyces stellatus]
MPSLVLAFVVAAAVAATPPACTAATFAPFLGVIQQASTCQATVNYTFDPPVVAATASDIANICAASACAPLLPLLTALPLCQYNGVNLGDFASAVRTTCGSNSSSPSTTPKPSSSHRHPGLVVALVVFVLFV